MPKLSRPRLVPIIRLRSKSGDGDGDSGAACWEFMPVILTAQGLAADTFTLLGEAVGAA
jgi:hypothetical protein